MTYPFKRSNTQTSTPIYLIMGSQNFNLPTGDAQAAALLKVLEEACQAGISLFQFRDKDHTQLTPAQQKTLAQEAQKICRTYKVPFIIDDDLELMMALDADGIHIGQDDQDAGTIRKAIGPDKIMGVSANEETHLRKAIADGADYVGCGPVFATASKANVRPAIGLDHFKRLQVVDPSFPVFAIGGIHRDNVDQVKALHPDAMCFISEIAHSSDVSRTVAQLAE